MDVVLVTYALKLWNTLPLDIREASSREIFKGDLLCPFNASKYGSLMSKRHISTFLENPKEKNVLQI